MRHVPCSEEVRLQPEERAELEARVRAPRTEQRHAFRARIVLMAAEGGSTRAIARELGMMPRTVSLWRIRFAERVWPASTIGRVARLGEV